MLLFISYLGHSQDAVLSIGTTEACPNTEVIVPVSMENFYDVGAISLYIGYDSTLLEFNGLQNIHPQFSGLLYNDMTFPTPQIGISWTSISGANVTSGVFFEMKFQVTGGPANLTFNPGCEITTTDLEIIPVDYVGGSVNPLISITAQPEDQQVGPAQSASFMIESTGGESFQWQQSAPESPFFTDISDGEIYQGVNTETLQITEAGLTMNGTKYRCRVISGTCIVYSDAAVLTVEALVHDIELEAGWNSLSTYIDPTETDLEAVLAGILPSLVILITDDGFYYPDANTNTIGDFDPTKGYSLKLTNHETLSISGIRTENNEITLPAGWSYLPVRTDCNTTIAGLFGAGLQDVIIIKEIAGNNVFWPENNIATLQVLEPGKAYLIKTSQPIDITYPDCDSN